MKKLTRPITVLVAQGIVLVFAGIWATSLVFNLVMIVSFGSDASLLRMIAGVVILASVVGILVTAFWGLAKKRIYGKWLTVLSLSFLWLLLLLMQIRRPQGTLLRFEYNSAGEVIGAVVATVFVNGLFLILILRLALSKSVDRFFRQEKSSTTGGPERRVD